MQFMCFFNFALTSSSRFKTASRLNFSPLIPIHVNIRICEVLADRSNTILLSAIADKIAVCRLHFADQKKTWFDLDSGKVRQWQAIKKMLVVPSLSSVCAIISLLT